MRFIDSNVFVYHLATDSHYGKRATEILESVENGEDTITSTLPISLPQIEEEGEDNSPVP